MNDDHDCISDEVPAGRSSAAMTGCRTRIRAPRRPISGFRLDDYEVTVARFATFVTAWWPARGRPAAGAGIHTHLNDKAGLLNVSDAGPAYETGWDPAWDANLATTQGAWDTNLMGFAYSTWFPHNLVADRVAPDQRGDLVRGLRLLHLGRRISPERGRVELRRRRGR